MNQHLKERLDDYSVEAVQQIAVTTDGAWRAGRRRRRTRRAALAGAAAACVAAVAVATLVLPGRVSTDPASRPGVDDYPVRIADPWFTGDLEAGSGPLAGVLVTIADDRYAITEDGALLEIPYGDTTGDFLPTLSSDGTKLGYLRDAKTYVLQDLATDRVVEFDEIGDSRSDSTLPYQTTGQAPGFWSPSGEQLLIMAWRADPASSGFVALGLDGTITEVRSPQRTSSDGRVGNTVGWVDDEHVGWVQRARRDGARAVDLVVTDLAGRTVSRTPLDAGAGIQLSQWSGSLSDDGTRLLLRTDDLVPPALVDTETGETLDEGVASAMSLCGPSWRGDEPLVPTYVANESGDDGQLTTLSGQRVAIADPSLDVLCIAMASHGLAGSPAGGLSTWLFGTSEGWLSWHYLELLAGGLVLIGVTAALWTWRRRYLASRSVAR
jgi:hypothetical protein